MSKILKLWHTWSWAYHILAYILAAVIGVTAWITTVSAYDSRIEKLEGSVPRLEKNLSYLMGKMGVPYQWDEPK